MSEQKDPIAEQIERDAKKGALAIYPDEDGLLHNSYGMGLLDGATAQDKIATNRTVEAVIKEIKLNYWRLDSDDDLIFFIQELEKLRR